MRAVDTNVLVRLLVKDEERQTARTAALLKREKFWIAKTVLLELDWVLRKLYGFARHDSIAAIEGLCGMDGATIENIEAVGLALDWARKGLDFADALHWASRGPSDAISTLDQRFAKAARKLGLAVELV